MTFDKNLFRAALSRFATGVTIVTARDQLGTRVGMTASSFNSVSMDPALILWSVTKSARSASVFKESEYFAVHVLTLDQAELSNNFATVGGDKFASLSHNCDLNGVPIIPDVASRFDCKLWAVHDGGDHWIIIGMVLGMEMNSAQTLLFADGKYATLASLPGQT